MAAEKLVAVVVKESSVAVAELSVAVEKESSVVVVAVAAATIVAMAVEGSCDCCLLYRIYYFIVVDILFYCN